MLTSFDGKALRIPLVRVVVLAATLAFAFRPLPISGQEAEVPTALQVTLISKILHFDRTLVETEDEEIVVAIAFQDRYRPSLIAKDEALKILGDQLPAVGGHPVRVETINAIDLEALTRGLDEKAPHVLLVMPLRAIAIEDLAKATRMREVLSCSIVPGHVAAGLSIGVALERSRPRILVNLEASRAEGSRLDPTVLEISRIVSEELE